MKVHCLTCERDDIPETHGLWLNGACIDGDTTINDHIRLWHPDEYVRIESIDNDKAVIRATGEKR